MPLSPPRMEYCYGLVPSVFDISAAAPTAKQRLLGATSGSGGFIALVWSQSPSLKMASQGCTFVRIMGNIYINVCF